MYTSDSDVNYKKLDNTVQLAKKLNRVANLNFSQNP